MEQNSLCPSHRLAMLAGALFLLFSLFFVPRAHAANKYWIGACKAGGTSTRFEDVTNWATQPEGSTNPAEAPGASDIAIFNKSGSTVQLRSSGSLAGLILSPNWTGSLLLGTGTLKVGASGIRIGSGRLVGGNAYIMDASDYTQTGGIVTGIQRTLSLSGSLSITSVSNSRPFFTSTGTVIFSGNGGVQNFTVGQNRVTSYFKNLTVYDVAASPDTRVYVSGSGMTLTGALTVTAGSLELTKTSTAQALVVRNGITVANATSAKFKSGNNITLSGSLSIGTNATWTATGGTLTLNGSHAQSLTLNGGGRRFQTVVITNTGTAPDNRITVSGGGFFASGSLTVNSGILDLMTNSQVLAVKGGLTLANSSAAGLKTASNVTLSGSVTVGAASTLTITGGTLTFNGDNPQTITLNNTSPRFNNVTLNNGGATTARNLVTFAGNAFSLSGSLTVTAGSLDLAANDIALGVKGNITVADSALARLLSDAAVTLSGSITVNPAGVFTMTNNTFTLDGGSQTLSGALAFSTLEKSSTNGDTLTFSVGNTVTATTFNLSGAAGTLLTLASSLPGTRWSLSIVSASVNYLSVTDSNNTNLVITCYDCTDGGNNLRWNFRTSPTTTTSTSNSGVSSGGGGGRRGSPSPSTPAASTPATPALTAPAPTSTKPLTMKEKAALRLEKRKAAAAALKANVKARLNARKSGRR